MNFAAESHNSLAVLDPARFFRTTSRNAVAARSDAAHRRQSASTTSRRARCTAICRSTATRCSPRSRPTGRGRRTTPRRRAPTTRCARTTRRTGCRSRSRTAANNYGPAQFPEKVIPLFVTNALDGLDLPLYASTQNKREWLHVRDHCRAIELVLERGARRRDVQRRLGRREDDRGDRRRRPCADRRAGVAEDDRARPPRPRPPLPARLDEAPAGGGAEARDRLRRRDGRDGGVVPRAACLVGAAQAACARPGNRLAPRNDRQPPVPLPEQPHRRGDDHEANERRVEEDRDAEPDAELLQRGRACDRERRRRRRPSRRPRS